MQNNEDVIKRAIEAAQYSVEYFKDFEEKKNAVLQATEFLKNYDINYRAQQMEALLQTIHLMNNNNLTPFANSRIEDLKREIKEKENLNVKLLDEVKQLKLENKDIIEKFNEISNNVNSIEDNERLIRLTKKIHPFAKDMLLEENSKLLSEFNSKDESLTVIMAIDIRKSTDLMLNANSSDDFADFISGLCEGLKNIAIMNYGVFDKFTGDGILVYFPKFYSGNDAVLKCCITSKMCHDYFETYYAKCKDRFKIVIKTGLGIGIDYGTAKLLRVNDEPTIIGVPVVYACRLSNAPYGKTYLNQNVLQELNGIDIKLLQTEIDIKNQGTIIVNELQEIRDVKIKIPDWFKDKEK